MQGRDLYSRLADCHGHYCPMSTLGLRLGLEAVRCLKGRELEGWLFSYQARTCAVDGILLALESSSFAAGLQVEPQGQHLLLCRATDGRELSFALSREAMQLANRYRDLEEPDKRAYLELLRRIAAARIVDISGLAA